MTPTRRRILQHEIQQPDGRCPDAASSVTVRDASVVRMFVSFRFAELQKVLSTILSLYFNGQRQRSALNEVRTSRAYDGVQAVCYAFVVPRMAG